MIPSIKSFQVLLYIWWYLKELCNIGIVKINKWFTRIKDAIWSNNDISFKTIKCIHEHTSTLIHIMPLKAQLLWHTFLLIILNTIFLVICVQRFFIGTSFFLIHYFVHHNSLLKSGFYLVSFYQIWRILSLHLHILHQSLDFSWWTLYHQMVCFY